MYVVLDGIYKYTTTTTANNITCEVHEGDNYIYS
jgi:hypothetical protein